MGTVIINVVNYRYYEINYYGKQFLEILYINRERNIMLDGTLDRMATWKLFFYLDTSFFFFQILFNGSND